MTIGVQAALANGPQNDARGSLFLIYLRKFQLSFIMIFIVDAMDID